MKKQYYLITILLLFIINHVYSQDFWEQLYFPDTGRIRCISIGNSSDLFIGTGDNNSKGGLYRTTDMANTWELIFNAGNFSIHDIEINDEGDIFIGKSGFNTLQVSDNNGLSWTPINLPPYSGGWVSEIYSIGNDTIFVGTAGVSFPILIRSYDKGITWDSLFSLPLQTDATITDIIKTNTGEMYISIEAYMNNMGGVYKSTDNGDTWEFAGLFNHMVSSLSYNSSGDIFAGSWGWNGPEGHPGLFVLRNGQTDWDTLIWGPQVSDVVINSDDDIYFTSAWPDGVVRSLDDGLTFELINEGLPGGPMGNMVVDNYGFIYITSHYSSNYLAKSINTTVSIREKHISTTKKQWMVYPNPVKNVLHIKSNTYNKLTGAVKIEIFNIAGKLLVSKSILPLENNTQLNIANLPSGMYIIEVSQNERNSYLKIIKP